MDISHGSDLLLACSIGDLSWLKRGLSSEKFVVSKIRNLEGLTCLHLTAKNGHIECMKFLLDNSDIEVNEIVAESRNTPLHYSISSRSSSKNFKCMKILLDRGANIHMKNKFGQTVLHIASKYGDIKCLKYLLKCGCDFQESDNDGNTALKYAILHCHHECARLLQALDWGCEKEQITNQTLLENEAVSRKERKASVQKMKMKKQQAEVAYTNWLERRAFFHPKIVSPNACSQRLEVRKLSDTPTCATCTKVTSKTHITHPRSTPIKLNTKQVKRNLKGIGKPDEMHQYTNSRVRSHSRNCGPISRSLATRTTSLRSSRTVSRNSLKPPRHSRSAPVDHNKKKFDEVRSQKEVHTQISVSGMSVSNGASEQHTSTNDNNSGKVFTFGPEEVDSDEDDSLFHDVGDTNNLDSLALPTVVTKGKTPVEVLQLFRRLSTPTLNRSFSLTSGKNQHHRTKYHRRFSLGSIPEGRIVTNYAEDMCSDSQLLDDNFLEELIRSFSNSKEDISKVGANPEESPPKKDPEIKDDLVYSIESEESLSSASSSDLIGQRVHVQHSLLSPTNIEQHQLVSPKKSTPLASPPNSLKIVNLAWNSETNNVESQITESPLTPQKHRTPSSHNEKEFSHVPLKDACECDPSSDFLFNKTCGQDSLHTPGLVESNTGVEVEHIDNFIPQQMSLLTSRSTLLTRPLTNLRHRVVHKRTKSAPSIVSFV